MFLEFPCINNFLEFFLGVEFVISFFIEIVKCFFSESMFFNFDKQIEKTMKITCIYFDMKNFSEHRVAILISLILMKFLIFMQQIHF